MPRQPRLDLPGIPQHIVQRGNDRQPCFFADIGRQRYLQDLRELAVALGCQVHAYVLMTNHVHLLMTASHAGRVARLMQSLGRRYVRYVNDHYHRTGTLWEGRYKSCFVNSDDYMLRCCRYIELNPVRAGMVADPADYRWSSHRANALGEPDLLVHPHSRYLALARTEQARRMIYRNLVMSDMGEDETAAIRLTLQRQHALGNDRFRDTIERQLGRRAGPAKMGRPVKAKGPT
ncbi:transposase [Pseudoxanthomonas wuyuanensis]|uniref:Putative transposase n=1 Tax=Pseudoxanthomonas wuyuanensis TaxID=1073196 RepID=A0A286DH75_9GAMM|nr:transposase [Pseudoxanthomonas wuyuanensis]KAF1719253.1 transposase [Pseudoxanthomonas wuyuanensis]SOD57929.1 putative transposase [Pseudoxanthomonas wuyuanensis]